MARPARCACPSSACTTLIEANGSAWDGSLNWASWRRCLPQVHHERAVAPRTGAAFWRLSRASLRWPSCRWAPIQPCTPPGSFRPSRPRCRTASLPWPPPAAPCSPVWAGRSPRPCRVKPAFARRRSCPGWVCWAGWPDWPRGLPRLTLAQCGMPPLSRFLPFRALCREHGLSCAATDRRRVWQPDRTVDPWRRQPAQRQSPVRLRPKVKMWSTEKYKPMI